jgi:hypothetical protein
MIDRSRGAVRKECGDESRTRSREVVEQLPALQAKWQGFHDIWLHLLDVYHGTCSLMLAFSSFMNPIRS